MIRNSRGLQFENKNCTVEDIETELENYNTNFKRHEGVGRLERGFGRERQNCMLARVGLVGMLKNK